MQIYTRLIFYFMYLVSFVCSPICKVMWAFYKYLVWAQLCNFVDNVKHIFSQMIHWITQPQAPAHAVGHPDEKQLGRKGPRDPNR